MVFLTFSKKSHYTVLSKYHLINNLRINIFAVPQTFSLRKEKLTNNLSKKNDKIC